MPLIKPRACAHGEAEQPELAIETRIASISLSDVVANTYIQWRIVNEHHKRESSEDRKCLENKRQERKRGVASPKKSLADYQQN